MTNVHEPRELKNIDLSILNGKIVYLPKEYKYIVEIGNEAYRKVLPTIKSNSKERVRLLAKYFLYRSYLQHNKGRYCECGEFIVGKPSINICGICLGISND
jgi:hypothetical protein